ncbi:outer membrane lipoprotein carrier protein [Thiopseudomonas denitrificans]|uniref:Outer-membrane lipoprotein carrier protein n=2 Tax=Thiopseudomonas denitrificans TaxID=1501432 RepID=A0A4R6U4W6_9GAMM|nr:outer membrane lipoprotein carrier protein [Thiopseudomonas denitrificans]
MLMNLNKPLRRWALGLLLAALVIPAQADTAQDQAAEKLAGLLGGAQTLQGRFSQLTLDAGGTQLQESAGLMELKRPGMFRWVTEPPLEQELVSDGKKVWLYDPDLMQVTVQAMDERMTHTPALLLSGDVAQIRDSFEIEYRENGSVSDFFLTPTAKDTLFDSLRLSFKDNLIYDMQLSDAVGQRTNILFMSIRMNEPLDDSHFVFEIPDGVDVIEE